MAVRKRAPQKSSSVGLFSIIGNKYIPYWPLFALLAAGFLLLAFIYTKYLTPVYPVSATLVINDEQKGVQESETLRSLNVYAANTIVENEIQVLTSRTLMRSVVETLHLYAPVFEKGRVKPAPAYVSSPIIIRAREPQKLKPQEKVEFVWDEKTERVKIGDRYYGLNQWVAFPYGVLQFSKNPNRKHFSVRDMYFSLHDPRLVVAAIGANLEVSATSKLSSVINIGYKDEVPERGVDIVNSLLEAYGRTSVENNNRLAGNTLAFVTERVQNVESELDSIERQIQQFRTTEGIVDLSQQGRLYLESVAENDRRAGEINTQLAILNQVEGYVRSGNNRTGIIPTTLGISDPVLADLLQKLNDLELQYSNMRARIGEENPMVQSVQNEIQKIRPNILNIVRNQRQQLQASLSNYNRTSNQASATLRSIPQKERRLLEISRQQAVLNDVYAFLLQRREEAELSNAATIADSRVVDRAEAGVNPASSKRMIILIGALIAAFALGIAYVFLIESMTGKVLFRSDVSKNTSLPIAAEIVNRKNSSKTLSALAADNVLAAQFLQLSAALGLYENEGKQQKILVTSNQQGEGKTFISNGLAMSLAAAGQQVVIVDMNLHQSATTALHHLSDKGGITQFLGGGLDANAIVHRSEWNNLFVIPAGAATQNATALLLNERLQQLLDSLQARFDYVIIDAPAIEPSTDAYILSKYTDQTLMVVRHRFTPLTQLQKLDENPKLLSLEPISIVLNGIKGRGFLQKYYGYGYGYGHDKVYKQKQFEKF